MESDQTIPSENEYNYEIDQLHYPTSIIVDKRNNSLIICDRGNRRVIRLSRENETNQKILIDDIHCFGLAINKNESVYVSDLTNNEVRRWKEGEKNTTLIAGGNERGNNLDQFNIPSSIFVDDYYSLYVSDMRNHRMMKWTQGARNGTVVAGEKGQRDDLRQLFNPQGIIIDNSSDIYVADCWNCRVMRWCRTCGEGTVVIRDNEKRRRASQFFPSALSFDSKRNLYVGDQENNRVQKFERVT